MDIKKLFEQCDVEAAAVKAEVGGLSRVGEAIDEMIAGAKAYNNRMLLELQDIDAKIAGIERDIALSPKGIVDDAILKMMYE